MKKLKVFLLIAFSFCMACTSEIKFDKKEEPIPPDNPAISDLIISELATFINTDATAGGKRNGYIELYNGTDKSLDLSNYAIGYQASTDEKTLVEWSFTNSANVLLLTGIVDAEKTYVIASPQADPSVVPSDQLWGTTSTANADASKPLQLSGNSAIALLKKDAAGTYLIADELYKIIDVFGAPNVSRVTSTGSSSSRNNLMWPTAGENDDTRNRTFWRKNTVTEPNSNWELSRGTNALDSEWILSLERKWDYSNIGKFTNI
ncbi:MULTISPECIES: lamin tail domain-containing protein [Flavobacterium]|uniref:lamin tail domain-containing protein n=1 Tax=Flavobacterium TaxID=237 RepID=UPI0022AC4D7F|nr:MULTISPECIES: lamin tail domain-containing protein [Flavobacterium]